ncbi:hypothetical protein GCM10027290_16910 [Micromonospora sonneratiae]|uniref:Lipoprotein n=1 Tax=Micromonospora sonneratiae TaxID=1184706 RepID=A0ABW3YEY1_9ACTN
MRSPARTACLLLAVLAGPAGCAPAQPADPAPPPIRPQISTDAVDLATRSGTWPKTEQILETALNRLTHECMAAQGFDHPARPGALLSVPEDEAAVIDLPRRRRYGYELASAEPGRDGATGGPPGDPAYERLDRVERQRYDLAFFGPPGDTATVDTPEGRHYRVPRRGCVAQSRQGLVGDVVLWARITYLPEGINNRLAAQVPTAPSYVSAMAVWRSCMSARGHHHDTPQAARRSIKDELVATGPTVVLRKREIAVAVADGECAARAHLPSTALRVRREAVASLPESDLRVLAELTIERNAALAHAERITNGR